MVLDDEVTVVLPQRNQGSMTLACIRSLRDWDGDNWPIVVVDDGSQDGSAELISLADVPRCHTIVQPSQGVTAAWNAGLRSVQSPFVVLLNNDVEINDRCLEFLVAPLRNRQAAVVGVEWRCEPLLPDTLLKQFPARRLLAGWCLAMRTELCQRVGGFDETLQIYYSDTDFLLRTVGVLSHDEAESVLAVVQCPGLHHLGHQTTRHDPDRSKRWHADRGRFLQKWHLGTASSHSLCADSCRRFAVRTHGWDAFSTPNFE